MKIIKLLIILLIPLLLLTGCGSDNGLNGAIKKTSIKEKGLKSYRCKVSIINKNKYLNYIVLNNNNKSFDISISNKDGSYSFTIGDDSKGKAGLPTSENEQGSINSYYDYPNTDIFISTLKNVDVVKEKKETLDKQKYTKYEFEISKANMNKILDGFDMKTKKSGKGYVYTDKNNHIYLINYVSGDININISYTRYNDVK